MSVWLCTTCAVFTKARLEEGTLPLELELQAFVCSQAGIGNQTWAFFRSSTWCELLSHLSIPYLGFQCIIYLYFSMQSCEVLSFWRWRNIRQSLELSLKPRSMWLPLCPLLFPTMLTDTVCPERLISDGANGAKIATAVKWLIELLPGLNFSSWERDRETRLRSPFMRTL